MTLMRDATQWRLGCTARNNGYNDCLTFFDPPHVQPNRRFTGTMKTLTLVLLITLAGSHAWGQLPSNYQLDGDWLLDSSSYKARIETSADENHVAIANGLIRRTFQLKPAVATVGLDNLMTGETIIRAVGPEGYVTLDGVRYAIGGLKGQPNRAFITAQWLGQLTPFPRALQLIGIETGTARQRFPWKQTRHHAPNCQWPPRGVYLRMDYRVPKDATLSMLEATLPSNAGRKRLASWDERSLHANKTLDDDWAVFTSEADERSSFENEGKFGEIYTPANTCVFIEAPLDANTRLVETTIDTGTDNSASWGPGITLVLPQQQLKFYIRPGTTADGGAQFALWDGKHERFEIGGPDPVDLTHPWRLRLRWTEDTICCDVSPDSEHWQTVKSLPWNEHWGTPQKVRIGKTSRTGGKDDFRGEKGARVRLKVLDFAAYGQLNSEALSEQEQPNNLSKLRVSVHYELYDGVPLLSKWLSVSNNSDRVVTVDRFTAEELAVVEQDNPVETREGVPVAHPDSLHVETDMAFSGFTHQNSNRHTVHWRTDPEFKTQINYLRQSPSRLVVEPTYGPAQTVEPEGTFETFRVFELVYDSSDFERRGLALKRMYRTLAPWVTENPLMMHMRTAKPAAVRGAIDQCADVGFEMLILSFGSGFNAENDDPAYLQQWKEVADYAHSRGVQIGCYSLLSSRRVAQENMIVSPPGQRPTHGNCPALTSSWGQEYFRKLRNLFQQTGFDLLEHDGSYPGDVDVTQRLPLQQGIQDSRWAQWRIITDYYKWLRGRGVYLNVPDYYYLAGSNKCGMGYRESNWSLPREQQLIHTRQNIYDGSWTKTPSMGWMFVPLTAYHGGGAAATIEPLDQHLDHYRAMMNSNLALGVQACYRGPRLFDTERTRNMVKQRVAWFKAHRDILESDLVHGRRADGRDLDWMLHVNPQLDEKGLLAVFNPTDHEITKTIRVPLYYTGIRGTASFSHQHDAPKHLRVDHDDRVTLTLTLPATSFDWYVIRSAE